MLTPTTTPIANLQDSFEPKTDYQLRCVELGIVDESTAIFEAKAEGPAGATAWVRAWLSNEPDETLADAEIGNVATGTEVTLTVNMQCEQKPTLACIRIESERLATKYTVHVFLNGQLIGRRF